MARTIALSEDVYRKLRQLKEALGVGYSELVDMLIEAYKRYRVEELRKLCSELKLSEEEVEEVVRIVKGLRGRRWW